MLYQEDDPDLYYEWLNSDECLTIFNKYIEWIIGKSKVPDSPSVQGPQYYME